MGSVDAPVSPDGLPLSPGGLPWDAAVSVGFAGIGSSPAVPPPMRPTAAPVEIAPIATSRRMASSHSTDPMAPRAIATPPAVMPPIDGPPVIGGPPPGRISRPRPIIARLTMFATCLTRFIV